MEKYYLRAASTMNYLFLRSVVGKTKLDGVLKEELRLFFEELSKAPTVDKGFYEVVKAEMEEGDYMDGYSKKEFIDLLAEAIEEIMGEVDGNIYNLYTSIAGEISEE